MTRLYGRARGGARCRDAAPHGGWNTTTMIGSVRGNGETATMVIEGAIDAEVFREYLRCILCPTLRSGDLVIMDNLSSHKNAEAEDLIRSVEAEPIFLPPYSPDLNPIEKMWSKVKAYLRKAKARTAETLLTAIRDALRTVKASDARGWFRECGYVYTVS